VLAGSRSAEVDTVARHAGVACKALAPVAGRPMIERVLGTLIGDPRIGPIEVSLPRQARAACRGSELGEWIATGRVERRAPRPSPAASVAGALSRTPEGHRLLVTTADHALLSAAILNQFLERAAACPGHDVLAGLLLLSILEAKYPGMKRTGLRLRDGCYYGCNLFIFQAGAGARSLLSYWTRLEALRKSPWRMARALGPATLIRYALGRMSLSQALKRIGASAGARVGAVLLDIPEAAIDVDTPGDLMFVDDLARAL